MDNRVVTARVEEGGEEVEEGIEGIMVTGEKIFLVVS